MPALPAQELETALTELPLWHLSQGKLVREFGFPTFVEALTFVNRVATIAEAQDHHPDIDIRYNKVTLRLISHDANGITRRDLKLAALLDADFPAQGSS